MVKQKFLVPWFSPSFSHNSEILERTEEAFSLVFEKMRAAIDHNKVDELTLGQIVKPVFRKFN